ncbi:MAG: hypothetical protein ACYTG2_12570 [Planctomycetota bacterium]|jgi:hypothetical protein
MHRSLFALVVFLFPIGCASSGRVPVGPLDLSPLHAATPAADGVWSNVTPEQPVLAERLPLASSSAALHEDTWRHHATFFIGTRDYSDGNLDQDFGGGMDMQLQKSGFKGLEIDAVDTSTGHGYEVGVSFGYQEDSVGGGSPYEYLLTTEQIYGGYRHTFRTADENNTVHPYVGVGLSVFRAHIDTPGFAPHSDDASAPALYARLGITWYATSRLRLGVDYRHLGNTNEFTFGTPSGMSSADLDHDQIAITIGYLL